MPTKSASKPIVLSDNARTVLERRYLAKDDQGNVIETPEQLFHRVAHNIAQAERNYGADDVATKRVEDEFYTMMTNLDFLPNSPTIRNAGTNDCLSACFVIPIEDSMEGICEARRQAALVIKAGGGFGIDFSHLRPRGDLIKSTHRGACGPISVMRDIDILSETFTQGAGAFRKGAQMHILRCDHPNIFDFIHCKDDKVSINNANISVAITDEFIAALNDENDHRFDLRWGNKTYETIDAHDLWNEIAESAWKTGDPGLFFVDRVNGEANPMRHISDIAATNPCLSGSTLMLTSNGLQKIEDIVNQKATFWTPNGWESGFVWCSGTKNVVQVMLSNGQRIVTTPDHKIMVGSEWWESETLFGKPISPFFGRGDWEGNNLYNDDDLMRLGFFQGDGNFHDGGGLYVNIGEKDSDVSPLFDEYRIEDVRKRYVSTNSSFASLVKDFEFKKGILPERSLPNAFFSLSPHGMRMFLRGLYSANGSVLTKAKRITLKTTCLKLAEEVQLSLLALGIRSYRTTNSSKPITWKNGVYTSRESYDLNITSTDITKFSKDIGFIQEYKEKAISDMAAAREGRRLTPRVVDVKPLGEELVYDFTVENSHASWTNGLLTHNCGEVNLLPYESCNLGSVNLAKFVLPMAGTFDWPALAETVKTATRFLDNVVEVNTMPTPETDRANRASRRIGLGVMGWADALAELHIPYASEESINLARKTMGWIQKTCDDMSLMLGMERGTYEAFNDSSHEQEGLLYRNAFRTVIAPTGTISILSDCSSGIEPIFAREWDRRMEDGTILKERYRSYDAWLSEGNFPEHGIPAYLQTAMEIAPEWHVRMQAAFQEHVDSAISKTINMSNSATVEDVKEAYRLSLDLGCRGITIYRDGCRDVQVLNTSSSTLTSELPKLVSHPRLTRERLPDERHSITHRFSVGGQEGYLTVGLYEDGRPGELFIKISKQGSTVAGLMDAIALLTSLSLQYGVPASTLSEKLKNVRFEPAGRTENKSIPTATSLVDYIFRYLDQRFGANAVALLPVTILNDTVPVVPYTIPSTNGYHSNGYSANSGVCCPECGIQMHFSEGCLLCQSCGYSKCG